MTTDYTSGFPPYKKRIKNSVVMLIIAQLIFPIKEILISYFGNGY